MLTVSDVLGNGNCSMTVPPDDASQPIVNIRVYKRRFWMLFLFSFMSMLTSLLFVQYTSMANVSSCYYGVSQEAVGWTSLIVMVVYIVLVFPVSSLINYMDLRWTVICASFFSTVAAATLFATLNPNSFALVMLSSFFSSISIVFVLGLPPLLAAKWFPSTELSRACACGVFGNQLGIAFGFIFAPIMVSSDCTQKDLISVGKRDVAFIQTSVNFFILILVIFTFQNAPNLPPSISQAQKRNIPPEPYKKIVFDMFKNLNFILIFIIYGLMIGMSYAVSTNLNNLILRFFPHKEVEIGWMGLLFIVSGMVGSMIAGYVLDRTHRFKEISLGICIASLLSLVLFSCLLNLEVLWVQFIGIGLFGFFLTSFLPIGFEYGLEMTYPLSESVCACLLNASTMVFGIFLTEMVSHILESKGPIFSNSALCATLLICCIIASFVSKDYKRSKQNTVLKTNDLS